MGYIYFPLKGQFCAAAPRRVGEGAIPRGATSDGILNLLNKRTNMVHVMLLEQQCSYTYALMLMVSMACVALHTD